MHRLPKALLPKSCCNRRLGKRDADLLNDGGTLEPPLCAVDG
jgi:hypothetical protein